jgi:Ca2+-transporting ATPase
MDYHSLSTKASLKFLNTTIEGLDKKEVNNRLKKYGLNSIKKEKPLSALSIFLKQFIDPVVLILILAVLVSFFINEKLDAIAITFILFINAVLGFFQEYKAEKSIRLLKKILPQKSKVIRNGKEVIVPSKKLIPGDILLLEAGDKVPADGRIIQTNNFKVDESTLTGESVPVNKYTHVLNKKTILADRVNLVFSGTTVTAGNALVVVTHTAMNTELGKIAHIVRETKETKTPLQKKLSRLSKDLGLLTILICSIVILFGFYQKIPFIEIFRTALSLAISVIPEGLPAVVTISLAIGIQRMLKKNALIRKLKSVETLGSVSVICSDKTGTITENEMTVVEMFANNENIQVKKDFLYNNKKINPLQLKKIISIAISCNNATLDVGDPTEKALLYLAEKTNIKREEILKEIPFDSEKKYMITKHKNFEYIKGAPENVLNLCGYYEVNGKILKLTDLQKNNFLEKNKEMASKALRVLGFAYKLKNKTIFVGLIGMIDPPRKEVKSAIKLCKKAGIKTVMITGDHKLTAEAIAKKVGIEGKVIEGKELDSMSDDELKSSIYKIGVYARVNPIHKVRILKAFQENGEVVAMTGDGVNDAPALKKADIGIAMAIKGTDVSRESAGMILMDDNFSTIVSAVKEGRRVYDNIKKFIKFLLASNLDEVGIILLSLILKLPLPLLPLQILWINLITDSLPALALGLDPAEKNIMQRKPRNPKERILSNLGGFIAVAGLIACIASFGIFLLALKIGFPIDKARTMTLTTIVMFEFFFVFSCRSNLSIKEFNIFSNRWLIGGVLISFLLHCLMIYTPLSIFLKVTPLGLTDWLLIITFASSGFIFFETKKLIKYYLKKTKEQ